MVDHVLQIRGEALAVNGNGTNGHPDEAEEGQPSLLSWAEFMAEEPVKPKRRSRKAQAPALPPFEWALEQERAPVGAAELGYCGNGRGHRCFRDGLFLPPMYGASFEFPPPAVPAPTRRDGTVQREQVAEASTRPHPRDIKGIRRYLPTHALVVRDQ